MLAQYVSSNLTASRLWKNIKKIMSSWTISTWSHSFSLTKVWSKRIIVSSQYIFQPAMKPFKESIDVILARRVLRNLLTWNSTSFQSIQDWSLLSATFVIKTLSPEDHWTGILELTQWIKLFNAQFVRWFLQPKARRGDTCLALIRSKDFTFVPSAGKLSKPTFYAKNIWRFTGKMS